MRLTALCLQLVNPFFSPVSRKLHCPQPTLALTMVLKPALIGPDPDSDSESKSSEPRLANTTLIPSAIRLNPDSESGSKSVHLRPNAKLKAGYIRYIRILPTTGSNGEICFEACIRRAPCDSNGDEKRNTKSFFYSAISYAWGDSTPSHTLLVDWRKRLVAKNLWTSSSASTHSG
jgi:hypothetical protein